MHKLFKSIFGSKHERDLRQIQPIVDQVNALEPKIKAYSDNELKNQTGILKQKLEQGASTEDILYEAFATCREAARRLLNMRHYDVQIIGGFILHQGRIAEMKTGEGKTLVATLPVYLNALSGKGVHVVTVNDYLAQRDMEWMGQIYRWLGLTTGVIHHDMDDQERREAYHADITYATNNELGFDYLRDNMKFSADSYVQKKLHYAIVDECDSILIDEARTPLIISGPAESSTEKYHSINKIIPQLEKDTHFTMEEKTKTVSLTDEGNHRVEELLSIKNLFDPQHIGIIHHIYQSLKAHYLFKKDVDYMLQKGEVVIVDEFTGRLMPGRRWSDGLHQAVEAKEGVRVRNENQTLASITFQNYFRMYEKLSGMTGTADTEAIEFKKIYQLEVSVIPTNKPIHRTDYEDVIYKTDEAKLKSIVTDIQARSKKGQPILVGTVSIEKSEKISRFLQKEKVDHEVLNAKNHAREADIISQAGRKSAVTIATNMAGRGTDIVLGGNPEFMAKMKVSNTEHEEYEKVLALYEKQCLEEREKVVQAGGLYVIGTERHEARRIDNQLRGRSGRQGDPGASRFYLSLEDSLMRIFNGERLQRIMNTLNLPDDEPITAKMVSRAIEGAQKKVEGYNFDIRKHLLDYDDVMNQQRTAIYKIRKRVLQGKELDALLLDMLADVISEFLDKFVPEKAPPQHWKLTDISKSMYQHFGIQTGDLSSMNFQKAQDITEYIKQKAKAAFDEQRKSLKEACQELQRILLLQTIDEKWKDYLQFIDHLKEGINLRGYAQKDPLIEYKKEAFSAFQNLNATIALESLNKFMRIQLIPQEEGGQVSLAELEMGANMGREGDDGAFSESRLQYQGSRADEASAFAIPRSSQQRPPHPLSGRESPLPEEEGKKLNRAQRRQLKRRQRRGGP